MKKIILYSALLIALIGKINAQAPNFYLEEIYQKSDMGISQTDDYTYSFEPNYFLNSYGSTSSVEYTYLWAFGDGQYSTEYAPTHTYAEVDNPTEYHVVLYATPIYSPIGPPPAAYLTSDLITINTGSPLAFHPYMSDDALSLSYNRLPRASFESTFILTYRNLSSSSAAFPVHFDFDDTYFDFKDAVTPGGEELDGPPTSINVNQNYTSRLTFVNNEPLAPYEERTIFIQMKAKDAVIGEGGAPELWVQAESTLGLGSSEFVEMSMYAVGSWDPNNKISSIPYINRDLITFPQTIRYRINCENVGTGLTSTVQVIDEVSPLLDFSSFVYVDDKKEYTSSIIEPYANMSTIPNSILTVTPNPYLTISLDPVSRRIIFDFNELFLKGTNSTDNVSLTECQFWFDIEFEIDPIAFENNFGSAHPCTSNGVIGDFGTLAEITFDNHDPIPTNVASTEVYCEAIKEPVDITHLFPNPTVDIVNVTYENFEVIDLMNTRAYLIDVNSGLGQELVGLPLDGSKGTHIVSLNLSEQNPGTYIFAIHVSGVIFESSIIIKR